MKYPFSQFGSAALLFSPLKTLPTPSLPVEWWNVEGRAHKLCQHCSAVARNWGVTDTFLGPNKKHSTMGALGGKFPLSQPDPFTGYMAYSHFHENWLPGRVQDTEHFRPPPVTADLSLSFAS